MNTHGNTGMSPPQFLRSIAIGDRLKETRLELGMSTRQMAEACNVSEPLWESFECLGGKYIPASVLSMASGYGLDVLYVLTGFRLTQQQINDMDAINSASY